jgi:hypothetical protein
MGDDITMFVERQSEDGRWEYAQGICDVDRNYGLFARLCGFRAASTYEPEPPIAEARGVPEDISSELRRLVPSPDEMFACMSPSWLTYKELCSGLTAKQLKSLHLPPLPDGVVGRIVFWFTG